MADDPTTDPAKGPGPADAPPTDLGEGGKSALEKERAARKAAEAKVKELTPIAERATALEEANKTEAQRQADALTAATRERDEAATAALRFQVAAEKGVPADLITFLPSGTKDEIEAAADTLLARVGEQGGPRRPAPIFEQGTGGSRTSTAAPRDEFAGFLANQLGGAKS